MAESMEIMEMCEWFESMIEDMVKEYQEKLSHNLSTEDIIKTQGSIEALDNLLQRLNEE
jgi:hypothetical protein